MTQEIVVLGGLGDAYLVAALFDSFRRHHRCDAVLVVKSGHTAVVDLFPGVPCRVDDAITFGTEADRAFQADYPNDLGGPAPFFAHFCMTRTPLAVDGLPARPFVCQADLFRMVLGLPLDAPLALPQLPQVTAVHPPGSVMVVEANTWPNTQPGFYPKLVAALRAVGREVWINDRVTPLFDLFARAAATEWVIGPQCGLISILVTGRFPCRKTLATPDIDGGKAPNYWAPETFPYAYVRRFAGEDFDVEEFKVGDDHDEVIRAILAGPNALRSRAYDPNPVGAVDFALSPGDFVDRFAVLTVKRMKFSGPRRAAIEREWRRHAEAGKHLLADGRIMALYGELVVEHARAFDVLDRAVPAALAEGAMDVADHVAAVASNKARVELKRRIDDATRGVFPEIKSYHGGGD